MVEGGVKTFGHRSQVGDDVRRSVRQQCARKEHALTNAPLRDADGLARVHEDFPWPGTGEIDPVSAMFSCLSESDADLIVAGGYGHSRLMERMLGGVSRTLARTLTVPVLMSH